ncbi:MAG: ABC transporter ATP-binding protein [Thermoplasmata archaeon]|nr:ABC transporter ATP-binding protein [Thermoplasmata archaeon]
MIKNLSFSLKPGNFLAVIGRNGAGKTTLLRVLSGRIDYAGTVEYNGISLRTLERLEIARIVGVVEQNVNLVPFRVFDVVCLGRLPYAKFFSWQREDFDTVEGAMKKVGIWHLRNRLITEISAGELQKTLIAKVLAQDAKLLLLDEPTSHLDLESQFVTMEILRELCREERTVIAVFHDINLAKFATHVLFLGEKSLFGGAEILTSKNVSEYLRVGAEIVERYFQIPI